MVLLGHGSLSSRMCTRWLVLLVNYCCWLWVRKVDYIAVRAALSRHKDNVMRWFTAVLLAAVYPNLRVLDLDLTGKHFHKGNPLCIATLALVIGSCAHHLRLALCRRPHAVARRGLEPSLSL